jgi:hypothetical protein
MTEITEKEYYKIWKLNPNMKVISSFSDVEGTMPFGVGRPAMDTTWGYDKPILSTEQRKDYIDEEWGCKYFKH